MMNGDTLRVRQGFRDLDPREEGRRVLFITRLDARHAYVRDERSPHRRSRILRHRLASTAFQYVGEMGSEPAIWPKWFREDAEPPPPNRKEPAMNDPRYIQGWLVTEVPPAPDLMKDEGGWIRVIPNYQDQAVPEVGDGIVLRPLPEPGEGASHD